VEITLTQRYGRLAPKAIETDNDSFEATLLSLCEAARQAWPTVTFTDDDLLLAFANHLGDRQPSEVPADGAVEIALADACARHVATALIAFEQSFLAVIPQRLAHMRLDRAVVDDVVQQTRIKLLTTDDETKVPRLVRYAGSGKLAGLVHVTASRLAIDLIRAQPRAHGQADHDLVEASDDPEMTYLKSHYRDAFSGACKAALAALVPKDRNLLRLHHLDGVGLEKLATMYNVNRSTIVRKLADIRSSILLGTRRRLAESMGGATATELDSVLGLIASQMNASVHRMLASEPNPDRH
jgi:RNA polymerase sigma-70 factor, ECF subfamily